MIPYCQMSVFVDTNVLLRSIEVSDPLHDLAVQAVAALIKAGEPLPNCRGIMERGYACRGTERVGLTPELAYAELAQIEGFFAVVGESTDVYEFGRTLSGSLGSAASPPMMRDWSQR